MTTNTETASAGCKADDGWAEVVEQRQSESNRRQRSVGRIRSNSASRSAKQKPKIREQNRAGSYMGSAVDFLSTTISVFVDICLLGTTYRLSFYLVWRLTERKMAYSEPLSLWIPRFFSSLFSVALLDFADLRSTRSPPAAQGTSLCSCPFGRSGRQCRSQRADSRDKMRWPMKMVA